MLGPVVLKSAQKNIKLRYSILKWYYSLFIRSNYSGTIFRPVFFDFPQDDQLYTDDVLDTQFLLGNELLATPIVKSGQVIRKAYFPKDMWYHFLTGMETHKGDGREHLVYCKLDDYVPLFLRGGRLVMQQKTKDVLNTKHLKDHFTVVVAMDKQTQSGIGYLADLADYNDEEEVVAQCMEGNCIMKVELALQENKFILTLTRLAEKENSIKPFNSITIDQLRIYGFPYKAIENMALQCETESKNVTVDCHARQQKFPYNSVIEFNKGYGVELGGKERVGEIVVRMNQ